MCPGKKTVPGFAGLMASGLFVLLLAACGGGSSGGGNPPDSGPPPPPPPTGPLDGAATALVATAIANTYVNDPIVDEEAELDLDGRIIERTRLEIVFAPDTTIGAANALLTELGATITSSLAAQPLLVVRIPDPGSLQALETLIADLESRGIVEAVIRSTVLQPAILPDNVEAAIFNGRTDTENATEWRFVAQHLAIRAHAAWNVAGAMQERPALVVGDLFGQGAPPEGVMDVSPLIGTGFDYTNVALPAKCTPARAEDVEECDKIRNSREHGYWVLGIAAGEHSIAGEVTAKDFITGMSRNGVGLAIVDSYGESNRQFTNKLIQTLETAALQNSGMIVLNLSLGDKCDADRSAVDPCSTIDDLRARTRKWINSFRVGGLENRVLVVAAASNREREDGTGFIDQHDAATASEFNAASLIATWEDELGGNPFPALTNTLVVENVRHAGNPPDKPPPFAAICTNDSSFTGGHVGGIGSGGIYGANARATTAISEDDGGTSSAAPQVAGLATYMSALEPGLTPQRTIALIRATARPVPAGGGGSSCTNVSGPRADLVDAYAAVLALDTPGAVTPADARVRLALLDVSGSAGDPDSRFDYLDLELLFQVVDPDLENGVGKLDYGRYDLNGDGYTGGGLVGRFDLDVSEVTGAGAFSTVANEELNRALDVEFSHDESAVTDLQVLCYYAYTELYSGDEAMRDALLATRKDDCGEVDKNIVAFTSDRDGNQEIYKLKLADGAITRLTNNPAIDAMAAWSPDRKEIAFTRFVDATTRDIFVMNADGSNERRLSNNAIDEVFPSWSPDGTTIAYRSAADASFWLMDANGSNKRSLSVVVNAEKAQWSPDGSEIVHSCNYQICIMNSDGSNQRELTSDSAAFMGYFEPSWSPDGTMITFARVLNNHFEVFVMNADGSGIRQLTNDPQRRSRFPTWSSDSRSIAYSKLNDGGLYDIYVMDASGSNQRSMIASPANDLFASWSN